MPLAAEMLEKAGTAIDAMIPIIATTTSNSTSENAKDRGSLEAPTLRRCVVESEFIASWTPS
jgi:hypothetical protein